MPAGNTGASNSISSTIPHIGLNLTMGWPLARTLSDIEDSSGTMTLTEVDTNTHISRQGAGPFTHRADFQTSPTVNGAGQAGVNTTLELHNSSKVNYLLLDSHVKTLYPLSSAVLGTAAPNIANGGFWSITAGD